MAYLGSGPKDKTFGWIYIAAFTVTLIAMMIGSIVDSVKAKNKAKAAEAELTKCKDVLRNFRDATNEYRASVKDETKRLTEERDQKVAELEKTIGELKAAIATLEERAKATPAEKKQ